MIRLRGRFVWAVAAKELLSTVRDRRTLTSAILLPLLLIPLLTVGLPLLFTQAVSGQGQAQQRVGVVGPLPAALRSQLTAPQGGQAGVVLVPVTDPVAAVRAGQVDAALQVQGAAPARLQVQLYGKLGSLKAESGVLNKLSAGLDAYSKGLVAAQLRARGVPEGVLTPLQVRRIDASRPQEAASGQLAFLIPMLLLQFILAGSMATAIDSTAGEKERGTLEVLLVSPIARAEVVVGKLLATTLTALTSAAFGLLGLLTVAPLAALSVGSVRARTASALQSGLGGQLSVSAGGVGVLVLMALSAALLLSALLLNVSIFARSYKEAQTYVAPISLLIVLPAVGLQFADFIAHGWGLYSVPVVGAMVVILDVVKGELNTGMALLTVAVNLLVTTLLVLLSVRSFGREQVIFRS